jgi:hypothetical protein
VAKRLAAASAITLLLLLGVIASRRLSADRKGSAFTDPLLAAPIFWRIVGADPIPNYRFGETLRAPKSSDKKMEAL